MQGADRAPGRALLVAGPTCSGKSALALLLANHLGGTIINADSMQIYRELRVLTARPTAADEARVPHLLYGVRPASEAGSVAWWRAAALAAMAVSRDGGRVPILCGGTGMYLASLTTGLAAVPDPGAAARAEARALLAELGAPGLHARLAAHDPASASRLRPSDGQRVARAWEVWRGTGRGLAAWQAERRTAPPDWTFAAILLDPPRPALRAAIAERFAAMLREGALEEVRAVRALGLSPALPSMRAHGVPELSAYLDGAITLDDAASRVVAATGRYIKRQATWFRHHPLAAGQRTIGARWKEGAQFPENHMADLRSFLYGPVDGPAMCPYASAQHPGMRDDG
ncbi:MAG: tRNA (adenosine(37)-N6)-dimethylallyltransferase MiaA [Acetobacteraceae bacterium]|nr:tRNA (adenosine(37)-N6)-dimethylallyltransferase MiaA [Acetobacteraceae bacterium]